MHILRIPTALSLLTGLILPACAHEGPTAEPPRPVPGTAVPEGVTNAQNAADLSLANRIANARCDRARECNDIGNGHLYVSRQLCKDEVRGSIANKVTSYSCPRGVDSAAVNRCFAAIDVLDCGKEAKVASMPECRSDDLCLK